MTDVAMRGALRRFARSRADLVTGLLMIGALAVAVAGAFALALEVPTWRGRHIPVTQRRPAEGAPRRRAR